jgi:hypothetical protein
MSHTPGPWVVHADGVLVLGAGPKRQAIVDCETSASPNLPQAERKANARLIAAAPELLAALKSLEADMDRAGGDACGMPECPWCKAGPSGDEHRGDCELLAARAAIAKAGGENV